MAKTVYSKDFVDPLSVPEEYLELSSPSKDDHPIKLENDPWHLFAAEFSKSHSTVSHVRVSIPQPLHFLLDTKDNEDVLKCQGNTPESRLAWLESSGDSDNKVTNIATNGMSQSEFTHFMDTCSNQLSNFWNGDQRVQVVKLTIQLSKMLSESNTDSSSSFELAFFAIADIISFFGQLVFDRLVAKSPGLKVGFSLEDVTMQARELCKNWLFKVASIRELVPRFYLETALLKCYRFSCDKSGYPAILERLSLMIRGITSPNAAAFARMFLLRSAYQALGPSSSNMVREAARLNYEEFIRSYKAQGNENLEQVKVPIAWLVQMQTYGLDCRTEATAKVIKRCFNELDEVKYPALILEPLIQACPSSLLRQDMTWLAHVVGTRLDRETTTQFASTLKTFLKAVQRMQEDTQVTKPKNFHNILNQCWLLNLQRIAVTNVELFLECTKHFMELWASSGQAGKMEGACNTLCSISVGGEKLMNYSKLDAPCKDLLIEILSTVLSQSCEFKRNFTFPFNNPSAFVPLYECLEPEQRSAIARKALDEYSMTDDFHIATKDLLLKFAKDLAATVNALSIADEVRQVSTSICQVMDLIDQSLGDNYEERLDFYTNCRELFKRVEHVQQRLVNKALSLAIAVRQRYGSAKAKIHAFLQACLAFSYITIPSISNDYSRLQSYLLSCQVAYQCRTIGQAEACVEAILENLQRCGKSEHYSMILNDFLPPFLSFLLLIPSESEEMLTTRLVKLTLKCAAEMSSISSSAQFSYMMLLVKALHLLKTTWYQPRYPYHIGEKSRQFFQQISNHLYVIR